MINKAKQLAEEIDQVFKEVEKVIPQLSEYSLRAKVPSWLPLSKGEAITMRDHILLNYAENQHQQSIKVNQDLLLTCALSFDIVSSAKHFDVDHFFPQTDMMDKLNTLEKDQKLLKETKSELIKILSKKQLHLGKNKIGSQYYARKIANKLIPFDTDQLYKVIGLKHIYYNFPTNLWPISGPVNRSKGKKESIGSSIFFVFKRIQDLLGEQQLRILAKKTAHQFKIPYNQIEVKTKEQQKNTVELISNAILKKFIEQCQRSKTSDGILPYIKKDLEVISMLSFFQKTPIGEVSKRFSSETAINAKISLGIARDLAFHAMAVDLTEDNVILKKLRSTNKGAIKILKIFCRSLRSELDKNLKESSIDPLLGREASSGSDSSSSLDLIATQIVSNVGNNMMESVIEITEKLKRKREGSEETQQITKIPKLKLN